jgi:hypothetical protein
MEYSEREGPFTLNLGMVILGFEQDENRRSKNREYLIGILETRQPCIWISLISMMWSMFRHG